MHGVDAKAQFTLIDDFESYTISSAIDGQGHWQAEAGANNVAAGVSSDPLDPSNRVLNIGDGGFVGGRLGHRETINTDPGVRIVQGTTATLFFRVAWEDEQVNMSVGMTDVANPISDVIFNSFSQFESQLVFSFAPGFDDVDARNGSGFDLLTTDVGPLEWYNIWMVINNSTDSTEFFIQGGSFLTQTQLEHLGTTSFAFRNGIANNDLVTLFIATGRGTDNLPPDPTENTGPIYLDDIHLDATGRNLANPVPEPSSGCLALVAWMALATLTSSNRSRRRSARSNRRLSRRISTR